VTLDQRLHTDTISFAHPGFSAVPYSADWPVEPPRKEIWRLASAVFAEGLRTRPARASTAARLLGQVTKRMLRQERRPDDLLWLLYLWQLEDMVSSAGDDPGTEQAER
jgi:hypothetical protein